MYKNNYFSFLQLQESSGFKLFKNILIKIIEYVLIPRSMVATKYFLLWRINKIQKSFILKNGMYSIIYPVL